LEARVPGPALGWPEDLEAANLGDVVQHAMNLKIHLIERLLHMQDVLCSHLDQAAAMPP